MLMSMAADVNAIGDNIVGATVNTNRYANADFNVGANVSAIGNYNTDANSHFKFDGNVNFNAKVSVNNCDKFCLSLSLTSTIS